MSAVVVNLFAGPGGSCHGARTVGVDPVGIELDPVVCATRAATGLATIRADVARFPTAHLAGRVWGLLGSPPCPTFSAAGRGAGRRDMPLILHGVAALTAGDDPRAQLTGRAEDPRSMLVLEVLRWVRDVRPEWAALEQVPPVLPLWRRYAEVLRGWGYHCWAGLLNSADYGLPQTRGRAVLMAHRSRRVAPPSPTHSDQRRGGSLFGLKPWVSMAEALGWGWDDTPARTVCGHRGPRWGYAAGETTGRVVVRTSYGEPRDDPKNGCHEFDPTDRPAHTITGKARSWTVRTGNSTQGGGRPGGLSRSVHEPARTVDSRSDQWALVMGNQPNSTVRTVGEPAPTVLFGHRCNDVRWFSEQDSVRITVEQAAVLQGFPAGYPWQGTKTQQFQQVGDAFPPPVAAAIIRALTGGAP